MSSLSAPHAGGRHLRLPVQWVSRPTAEQRRRYTGRLSAGTLQVGDPVVSLPAGTRSTVTALDTLDDDRATAVAPLSVSIELADDIDVGRGDVFVSGADDAVLPVLAREIDATVCWFADTPLRAGDRLALKQGTRTVRATVQALHSRLDPETLDDLDGPVELALNDIGIGDAAHQLDRHRRPLFRQPRQRSVHPDRRDHQRHRRRGHHHRGRARSSRERRPATTSVGIHRHWTATTGGARPGSAAPRIWFTGLPASGKSTVAVAVERALVESGRWPICSTVTTCGTVCPTTSGSPPGTAPRTSAASGISPDCSPTPAWSPWRPLVSPLKSDREIARTLNEAAKLPFIEMSRRDLARQSASGAIPRACMPVPGPVNSRD